MDKLAEFPRNMTEFEERFSSDMLLFNAMTLSFRVKC